MRGRERGNIWTKSSTPIVAIPERFVTFNISVFTLTGEIFPSSKNMLKTLNRHTPDEVACSSSSVGNVIDISSCTACKKRQSILSSSKALPSMSTSTASDQPCAQMDGSSVPSSVDACADCPSDSCSCEAVELRTLTLRFTILPGARYPLIVGRPDMKAHDLTRLLRYHFVGDMCVWARASSEPISPVLSVQQKRARIQGCLEN